MDPLTIALTLAAKFAPDIIGLLAGPKAGAVAGKVAEIAQTVTGQATPEAAVKALDADPSLALKFKEAVLAQQVELAKLAEQNAADVNTTMRAEGAAEHWPTYSWRPAIGFAVAIDLIGGALVTIAAYAGVMFFGAKPEVLSYLPAMLGSMAALVGVAVPILGIASYFRGKMQADPTIPTVNRG